MAGKTHKQVGAVAGSPYALYRSKPDLTNPAAQWAEFLGGLPCNGLVSGYLSHLALDATTPKSLPFHGLF